MLTRARTRIRKPPHVYAPRFMLPFALSLPRRYAPLPRYNQERCSLALRAMSRHADANSHATGVQWRAERKGAAREALCVQQDDTVMLYVAPPCCEECKREAAGRERQALTRGRKARIQTPLRMMKHPAYRTAYTRRRYVDHGINV